MTRRSMIFGIVILAAWAVTMGFLAKNHYFNPSPAPDYSSESLFGSVTPVDRWDDVEEYMLIVQSGSGTNGRSVVGASATHIRRVDDPTTTASFEANLLLEGKLSPILPVATVKVSSILDRNVNLTSFHGQASLGQASFTATGAMFNNILYLETSKSNGISRSKREMSGELSMAEALRPTLGRRMKIQTGEKMSAPILDPLTGRNRGTLTIEIGEKDTLTLDGQQVEGYKVVSSVGDIKTTMWVDDAGQTIRRQLVGGLSMERTTRDKALAHAPSLEQPVEIPQLDPADFKGIPTVREGDAQSGSSAGGLGMLEALLN